MYSKVCTLSPAMIRKEKTQNNFQLRMLITRIITFIQIKREKTQKNVSMQSIHMITSCDENNLQTRTNIKRVGFGVKLLMFDIMKLYSWIFCA
jgi:hypothetical protein